MRYMDRMAGLMFLVYVVMVVMVDPSAGAFLAAFSPLGIPLRRIYFEEAADQGAAGGAGDGANSGGSRDGATAQRGGAGDGAGGSPAAKGIDAEIEEAMRLTDQISDPDFGEDPEKAGGSGGSPDGAAAKGGDVDLEPEGSRDGAAAQGGEEAGGKEPGAGDSSDEKVEYKEGFDPNDVVDVEGSTYFYHPKEHAPDVKHGNVYRTRDDAEMAWTHKVGRVQELAEKLNELGKGVGPVDLPEWFSDPDNPASLAAKADIDEAIQLPNGKLRERLAEGDTLITYLDDRVKRVDGEAKAATITKELETRVDEIYNTVDPLIDELGLQEAVKTAKSSGDLRKQAATAVEKKIAADVKVLEKEYNDYKTNADARMDDEDYPDKLERKRDAIREKRRELKKKYEAQYLTPFDKMLEVEKEVAEFKEKQKEATGVSEKERLKVQNDAFMDFQAEMMEKHAIFQATDPKGVKAFRDWAVNRAEQFGGLRNSYQWGKAIKAFDAKIEQRRAEVRRKKIEQANDKQAATDANKKIPGYGNQDKLINKTELSPQERLDAEMEQLMEETDAKTMG